MNARHMHFSTLDEIDRRLRRVDATVDLLFIYADSNDARSETIIEGLLATMQELDAMRECHTQLLAQHRASEQG